MAFCSRALRLGLLDIREYPKKMDISDKFQQKPWKLRSVSLQQDVKYWWENPCVTWNALNYNGVIAGIKAQIGGRINSDSRHLAIYLTTAA